VTRTARVIIASTRAAAGVYEDRTGPVIVAWLTQRGFDVPPPVVVADGIGVNRALLAALGERVNLVLTSGGTGISPTDGTADATADVVDYQISRGVCGVRDGTLIVNLPGSTGGVNDGLGVLADVLDHALDQLAGQDHTR
jgi:molybdenum cofactor synthesis domain-containing protein